MAEIVEEIEDDSNFERWANIISKIEHEYGIVNDILEVVKQFSEPQDSKPVESPFQGFSAMPGPRKPSPNCPPVRPDRYNRRPIRKTKKTGNNNGSSSSYTNSKTTEASKVRYSDFSSKPSNERIGRFDRSERPEHSSGEKPSNAYQSHNERPFPSRSAGKRRDTKSAKGEKNTSGKDDKNKEPFRGDPNLAAVIERDMIDQGDTHFSDISGLNQAKKLIFQTIYMPLKRPDFFTGIRRPWKGIMLFGPPGTGKTMLARAVATELNTTFFSISASSLGSKFRGESENLVRTLFELARYHSPSVIFLDEMDALFMKAKGAEEHEASRRVKAELLTQMDGIVKDSDNSNLVVVIGATNFPWDLHDNVVRRLEKRIYVPLPDEMTRRQIIENSMKDMTLADDVDVDSIAKVTDGFSCADVAGVCRQAALLDLGRKMDDIDFDKMDEFDERNLDNVGEIITMDDFNEALKMVNPSVKAESIPIYEKWAQDFGST
eukprot:TRINITY_DN1392_c0_g1_i1.p1 TRINITY_DN1392_c0_g1~~TRINITY_DN1392_c0_g1_i1.p1  ORF type:complete len:535 (+),score=129.72 TRINITY_DN1392_c0_g1_i1:138-1607(+)